jgi:hypothetical protein
MFSNPQKPNVSGSSGIEARYQQRINDPRLLQLLPN